MYSAAEVIRAARRARGLSQLDLSQRCHVSQPNIAAYENGSRVPSLAMLERLVQGCGQQIRMELEARWADLDRELTSLLDAGEIDRMSDDAFHPYLVARQLAYRGAPLVLDGHLAARALGAPVRPGPTFAACAASSYEELTEAVVRSRSLGPINREHHGDLRIRSLVVRLVDTQPEPVWSFVAERGPEVHGLRRWDGPPPEEDDSEDDIHITD